MFSNPPKFLKTFLTAALCLVYLTSALASPIPAAAATPEVSLNLNFSAQGNYTRSLNVWDENMVGAVIDGAAYADGRYISAWLPLPGRSIPAGSPEAANSLHVIRLTATGSLDNSFGQAGETNINLPSLFPALAGATLAPYIYVRPLADGSSVISVGLWQGSPLMSAAIIRLTAAGSVDTTFGNQGLLLIQMSAMDATSIGNIILQPDAKIIVTGMTEKFAYPSNPEKCFVARFNSDGTPDTAFGQNGIFFTPEVTAYTTNNNCVFSTLMPNGSTLLFTQDTLAGNRLNGIIKVTSDGQPDVSFGSGGSVSLPISSSDQFYLKDAVMQGDKLLLLVQAIGTSPTSTIARFDATGNLDTNFAASGPYTETADIRKIRILQDGAIALSGVTAQHQAVRYLDRDGKTDKSSLWFYNPLSLERSEYAVQALTEAGKGKVMSLAVDGYQNNKIIISSYTVPYVALTWQNPLNHYDVTGDGKIDPRDVRVVIDQINSDGGGRLGTPPSPPAKYNFVDVNGDNILSPLDVLIIINYLNNLTRAASAEGEGAGVYEYFAGLLPAGSVIDYYSIKSTSCPSGAGTWNCSKLTASNPELGTATYIVGNYANGTASLLEAPLYDWEISGSADAKGYWTRSADLGAMVVKLAGTEVAGTYHFKDSESPATKRAVEWTSKGASQIRITVETTSGLRTLIYSAAETNALGQGDSIYIGLGSSFGSGNWNSFSRDIQQDLKLAQPNAIATKILSFTSGSASEIQGLQLTDKILAPSTVVYDADYADALSKIAVSKIIPEQLGQIFVQEGFSSVLSSELIPVNTQGTAYKLDGLFKSLGKNASELSYGLAFYDAQGRLIDSTKVLRRGNALTVKSASSTSIKTAQKPMGWQAAKSAGALKSIAFYFDGNTDKAPDYVLVRYTREKNLTKQGAYKALNRREISLNSKLPASVLKSIIKGKTKVMTHYSGSDYAYYAASGAVVPSSWTRFESSNISGEAFGESLSQFRMGTKFVRLVLLLNSRIWK